MYSETSRADHFVFYTKINSKAVNVKPQCSFVSRRNFFWSADRTLI